jgi:hypothetical protein
MVSYDNIGFYLLSARSRSTSRSSSPARARTRCSAAITGTRRWRSANDPVSAYARAFFDRDAEILNRQLGPDWRNGGEAPLDFVREHFARPGADDPVDKALRLDSTVMLVDDPVKRVDNMTMAWGLEARVPFLDHDLAELAARIPPISSWPGRQGHPQGRGPRRDPKRSDRPAEGLFPGAGAQIYRRSVSRARPRCAVQPGGARTRPVRAGLSRCARSPIPRRTSPRFADRSFGRSAFSSCGSRSTG